MFSQRPEDQYIEQILLRRAPRQIYQGSLDTLLQVTRQWAGQYVLGISFSGSFAKGTAVAGSSDIDLFVSLRNDVLTGNTPTLQSLYTSLNAWLSQSRYVTRLQNVSIGVTHGAFQVDVVPAVKHLGNTSDHSLHRRKTGTWTKTNVDVHINHIRYSGRTADIKAAKIWRNLHGLDISSFYLELAVLEALKGRTLYNPAANFLEVLRFLSTQFVGRAIGDPANTNNRISDELSRAEQQKIANQASWSLAQPNWGTILW